MLCLKLFPNIEQTNPKHVYNFTQKNQLLIIWDWTYGVRKRKTMKFMTKLHLFMLRIERIKQREQSVVIFSELPMRVAFVWDDIPDSKSKTY